MSFWRPIILSCFMSIGIGFMTNLVMLPIALLVMTPVFFLLEKALFGAAPAPQKR